MLDHLSPPRRRLVLAIVALGVTVLVVVAAVAVRGVVAGTDVVAQDEPGPVLVVPGYGGRVESLEPVVDALRSVGRDVTVVTPVGDGRGDLEAQADRLGEIAAERIEDTGASSVDVIGYSAGGVVARLWVRDGGGDALVRRVLTLGSPHHGADVAALAAQVAGGCPRACEQLDPDSDLLRALNAGDETPDGPEWITVRSDDDQVVTPTESAALDGALDLVVQELCPDATTSHTDLPGDPVVLATLESALGTAAPGVPADVSC